MLYHLVCVLIYILVAALQFTAAVASNAAFAGPFSGLFMKFPNHSLAVKSLSTKRVPNEMHCSMNCQRQDNCFSFNFAATNDSVGNFICELLPTKHSYKHINFKTNDSFHHFSRKVPQVDFCGVNAKSVSPNSDNTYDCPCKDGYTGMRCEVDIDECASSPCLNGKCKDKVNGYKCNCDPGYTGERCETDINECESNPCNKGTCEQDKVNSYKCNCTSSGFTGENCEIDINECSSNPCQNGAQCTDKINEFECNCTGTGYTGKNCETDINECSSNPCKNGGSCIDKVNEYECNCSGIAFGGKNCHCPADFTGTNCDVDIDECSSTPCQNGGTCSNQVNAYNCTCASGYSGTNCETKMQPCDSNPCQNGGSCTDVSDSDYSCACMTNYYRKSCDYHVHVSSSYKDYAAAQSDCSGRGLSIAKILSGTDNDLLKGIFSSDFWIGLKKAVDGSWEWRDGTKLDENVYNRWDSQPGSEVCVKMDTSNGKWKTVNCDSALPFACTNF